MRELNTISHGMVDIYDNTEALSAFNISCRFKKKKQQIFLRWTKPQSGWIKCNTDASAMGSPGQLKGGGLFRNSEGHFLGGFSANLGIGFAFEGELAVALLAIEIAYCKGWNQIWIECDCMYVIYMLNSLNPQVPWKCLEKWRMVKRHLSSIHWVATHVFREANASADCLANYMGEEVFYWWNDKPPWLETFLFDDLHKNFVRR